MTETRKCFYALFYGRRRVKPEFARGSRRPFPPNDPKQPDRLLLVVDNEQNIGRDESTLCNHCIFVIGRAALGRHVAENIDDSRVALGQPGVHLLLHPRQIGFESLEKLNLMHGLISLFDGRSG